MRGTYQGLSRARTASSVLCGEVTPIGNLQQHRIESFVATGQLATVTTVLLCKETTNALSFLVSDLM